MRVSVIVVSWNSGDLILPCLRSAFASAGNGIEVEVIVSDNGSTDGTPEAVEAAFPRAVVVRNGRNLGFAAGVNRGAARAGGDALLLLNSDTELNPAALRALADALEKEPRADAAAPRLVHPDGTVQRSVHPLPTLAGITSKFTLLRLLRPARGAPRVPPPPPGTPPVPVEYVIGAVVLLRRSSFPGSAVLDEDYFFYYEDADLCRRIRDAGRLLLFCPDATVLHHGGASSEKDYYRVTRTYFRSILTYVRKHHLGEAPPAWWVAFKMSFLLNLVYDGFRQLMGIVLRPGGGARRRWNRLRAVVDLIRFDARHALEALGRPSPPRRPPLAPCPLCGAGSWVRVLASRDVNLGAVPGVFHLRKCRRCGLLALNPPPGPDVLRAAYPRDYRPHKGGATGGDHPLPGFWSLVGPGPSMRILDVGCGGGRYFDRLRGRGCEVWGIEPDPEAAERVRRMGFGVHTGVVEDAPFPPPWFDVVSLVHVVEHLSDPVRTLTRAAGFLREGGRLLLVTPNADSLAFRCLRGAWYPLDSPRHLHLFNPRTLSAACRSAGLEVEKWRAHPHFKDALRSVLQAGYAAAGSRAGRLAVRILVRTFGLFLRDGEELRLVAVRRTGARRGP